MLDLFIIDNGALKNIIRDSRFDRLLPCLVNARERLAQVPAQATGCGRCSQKRDGTDLAILTDVRNCIVRLAPEQRDEFKRLLNTRRVKIVAGRDGALGAVSF